MIKLIYAEPTKTSIIGTFLCFGIWIGSIGLLISQYSLGIPLLNTFSLISIQFLAALNDIYDKTIPNRLIFFAIGLGLIFNILAFDVSRFVSCILAASVAYLIMKIIIIVSKRQVGEGDMLIVIVTAIFTGMSNIFSILFLSIFLIGIYSLVMLAFRRVDRKSEVAFVPFVLLGSSLILLM